jgi:broad specificity phosphatase PhoE
MQHTMILIRHGESTWNQERRIQGNLDPGLSDRGRAQAALLARRLAGRAVAAVYTSPLKRATETARVLADCLGLRPQPLDDLREIGLGAWEGKTAEQIRVESGDVYDRWVDRPLDIGAAPDGEPLEAFQQRAVRAMARIRAAHPSGELAIVTHGGIIKAYLCHLLGLDLNRLFHIKTDNAALTEVVLVGETIRLALVNDTCHLNGGGMPERADAPRRAHDLALDQFPS